MFREIRFRPARLSEEDLTSIAEFNELADERDLRIDLDRQDIVVRLRQADLRSLRKQIDRLSAEHGSTVLLDVLRRIESVRSYGVKAGKRLYAGYDAERKVKGRQKKADRRGKYYYARDHEFPTKNNPFPEHLANTIVCGDSEEVLKSIPTNSVDIIVTSPPYNFGLDYATDDEDATDWESYFGKLFRILDECIRVLKYGGRLAINLQPLFSDYIPTHHIVSNYLLDMRMIWKAEILWEKNNYNAKYTAWGSWKSPSSPYIKYTWEFVEVFSKGSLRKEGRKEDIDITAEEFKELVIGKWSIAPERNMDRYGHPAMFPEELVERLLKLFSYRGDLVLDPFNGVGTTTYVAWRLSRRYCGVDISEEYCTTAKRRIEEGVTQMKLELPER